VPKTPAFSTASASSPVPLEGFSSCTFLEILTWAIFYHQYELLPDLETAIYYSATSYSTLGYGDVILSDHWRILGAAEAVTGVLMFGWSTGALFMLANRLHGLYLDPQNRLK